ncbi:ATPase, histidine kinase-, DNA gyrase B-, and HSP90-like domain protein [Synechococcus sp. PCC 7335]|uniref:ATP-binding protein n=1 Tax=Synechococcus sp. (strain ATCC 29403 / PCC 7335) TaxID=91464 RepID=UPI00017EDD11|nr:ATP-binding protein [Synechococcus sp. PCC 7335]EDX87466.1 ATPase, histidine kinase-, DNA gyrase B-, and HSP90-like domain protein [Synechococcus sp. PCC 7335]
MATTARKVVRERRDYNTWVVNETLEDYSLRYAPKSFRKWSEFSVASTALGGISFLALEAIGGALAISYGFSNTVWAIVISGIIIFLTGVPITYYAAKYNIDMDLLTRGAGFGYIGSTITSLIYASFTFIFFALEAAIMAQALKLYFHLPLAFGYVLCSIIIIPLVFYGVTLISQLQLWTQPIWLSLMISPYVFVYLKEPDALSYWKTFSGASPSGANFHPLLFGMAATVSLSLIAQIGEQVDYLRFLPDKTHENRSRWWMAMILAGPGWILMGMAKQIGGAFLASLAIRHGASIAQAKEPIQMYMAGFSDMFSDPGVVLFVSTFFVIVSQIKINVTNAYAGSLAWSNFFSRITHSHPGRVVWLVFNTAIALLLMELGVFQTIQSVLALYSNIALAWIGALVADLIVNKPLGFSPSYIEFKRAYLYNFNPVGFGSMGIASIISIIAFVGVFGDYAQAYSPFIALSLAFTLSPIIAILTKGRYYIARPNTILDTFPEDSLLSCCICEQSYEPADMAFCPVYDGTICSLCCSLDAHCHDSCKPTGQGRILSRQIANLAFQGKVAPQLGIRIIRFTILFLLLSGSIAVIIGGFLYQSTLSNVQLNSEPVRRMMTEVYSVLLVLGGITVWLFVLSQENRELAEDELEEQNHQLQQEITMRQQTETALQELTQQLEHRVKQRTAELSQALSGLKQAQTNLIQQEKMSSLGQLVAGVAHEINNPVNFIHGNVEYAKEYIQDLLRLIDLYRTHCPNPGDEVDKAADEIDLDFLYNDLPKLLASMQIGTERIREIVLSLRTFSRLDEAEVKEIDVHSGLDSTLLILGHRLKSNGVRPAIEVVKDYGDLPLVKCYAGPLNQVFMNILANALDALEDSLAQQLEDEAKVSTTTISTDPKILIKTKVLDAGKQVEIRIADNGLGMPPKIKEKIFDPMFTTKTVGKGTGLGLSISYQIVVEKHQGSLHCDSTPGKGTEFVIILPVRASAGSTHR